MLADTTEPSTLTNIGGGITSIRRTGARRCLTLVNPPELFLDVGIDGIENTLDQGEGDGLFTKLTML